MKNKKFRDIVNNKVVQVTDQFEDIIILDGKSKIKINQLMNERMFEEVIDPKSFLVNESFMTSFADKLRNIPLDDWKNRIPAEEMGFGNTEPTPTDNIILDPLDPEIEKQLILKKYSDNNNVNNLIENQKNVFSQILKDEEPIPMNYVEERPPVSQSVNQNTQQSTNQSIQKEIKQEVKMDPILEMFKNVKRNTSFKIDFTVENKIPRIDFIEMMEDSYNTSIIDFLAQEFTDQILRDPTIIKERIKQKLIDLVYPDPENQSKNV